MPVAKRVSPEGRVIAHIDMDCFYVQVSILSRKGRCERASIDEVYLDLTDAAETMLAERPPESFESIDEEVLKSHVFGLIQDGHVEDSVKHWLCRSDADHCDKLLACGAFIVAELRAQVIEGD